VMGLLRRPHPPVVGRRPGPAGALPSLAEGRACGGGSGGRTDVRPECQQQAGECAGWLFGGPKPKRRLHRALKRSPVRSAARSPFATARQGDRRSSLRKRRVPSTNADPGRAGRRSLRFGGRRDDGGGTMGAAVFQAPADPRHAGRRLKKASGRIASS